MFGWTIPKGLTAEQLGYRQERLLREIRERIRNVKRMDQDGDQTEEEAVTDCYAIPDSAALNRILKYQALNDRRLQRALTPLERLQRQRKGEYVLPPAKFSVDGVQ